jgi:hypothetical protein
MLKQKKEKLLNKISIFLSKIYKRRPPICENVKQWCNNQPQSVCSSIYPLIRESQVIFREPPNTIDPTIHQRFLDRLKSSIPEKYLVCIRGAKLVGCSGLLLLPDGSYTEEVVFGKFHLEKLPEYYSKKTKCLKKYGNYYSLLQLFSCSGNYYHWMHDILQSLYLVIELLPKDIVFIVPNNLTRWQYESLNAIGLNVERLCSFTGNEIWELDTLYFSPPTTISGHDLPEANKWVQSSLYKKFKVVPSCRNIKERIFISRRLARGRKIVNETEMQLILQEYGFQTYLLEEMSLEEQVNLFAKAKVVVASHGAGLTNLMFAQPGTRVLEIFEPSHISSLCYWSLCESMKHKYWYLFGTTVDNEECPNQTNIYVPLSKLIQCLKQVIREQS